MRFATNKSLRHMLRQIASPLIVVATTQIAGAVMGEACLVHGDVI